MTAPPQPSLSEGSDPGLWAGERRGVVAAAFLRALATGMAGVLLGIYLAELGLARGTVGLVAGAGLGERGHRRRPNRIGSRIGVSVAGG